VNATTARAAAVQHKADLLRSLRITVAEGVMAMPIVTMSLPVNVFITALVAKGYPLPKTTIGLISSLPFVANFLQVFTAPLIAKWKPPKFVTVTAAACHLVTWITLGVILPWVPKDDPTTAGHVFVVWFLISSFFSAIAGVSWNAWIQEWVPPRLRGKYFGRRNGTLQISTLIFVLGAGKVLDWLDCSVIAFQAVIAVAAVMRVFSLRWQSQTPSRPRRHAKGPVLPLREQFALVLRSKSLIAFIAFGAIWSFAAYCFGPFYSIFMMEELNFSAFDLSALFTLSQLGGALSLPAWGKLLDRYGNKAVMTFSLILWQVQNFLWCVLTPENSEWLYGMWLWGGATSAGFILGQFTILLRLIPTEAKNLAIGFNLAVTSLVAAIAPIVGGWVLSRFLTPGGDSLFVYHVCFALQPVLALAGCLLLLRVHEPQASSLTMVFGAMRNIRTLSGVFGLSFLTNYIFFREEKKPAAKSKAP
jgi:MFS family permease